MKIQYVSLLFLLLVAVSTIVINAAPVDDQQEKVTIDTNTAQNVNELADEIKEEEHTKTNKDVVMKGNQNAGNKAKPIATGDNQQEEIEEDNNAQKEEKGNNSSEKNMHPFEEDVLTNEEQSDYAKEMKAFWKGIKRCKVDRELTEKAAQEDTYHLSPNIWLHCIDSRGTVMIYADAEEYLMLKNAQKIVDDLSIDEDLDNLIETQAAEEANDGEEEIDKVKNGIMSEQEDEVSYYRESTTEECKTLNGKMECKVKSCKWFHNDDKPVCTEYKKEVPLFVSSTLLYSPFIPQFFF